MDTTTLHAAVRRFPLLGRPRPACPALAARVTEIGELAELAATPGLPEAEVMAEAAHALNKAALLASDCGLPDLARNLCWQHINVYRAVEPPLTVSQARYMLEPALNLARLQIRAEAGERALRLMETMYQAVTAGTDLVVDGRTLPLAALTGTRQEQHKLREWVWLQYLADGIRALALAGRWDEAVAHATANKGIGLHLMEGRQAMIISHCLSGALLAARAVLEASTVTEPWERQVAACLAVMCAEKNSVSIGRDITVMVDGFLGQAPVAVPGYAVFRARLGLTVATLAGDTDAETAGRVLAQAAVEVVEAEDGYAAREVLGYRSPVTGLTAVQRKALSTVVTASGLGVGTMPEPALASLVGAARIAKDALAASMLRPEALTT
ncbi:hypothetical protein [Planomonospora algeriensis]